MSGISAVRRGTPFEFVRKLGILDKKMARGEKNKKKNSQKCEIMGIIAHIYKKTAEKQDRFFFGRKERKTLSSLYS